MKPMLLLPLCYSKAVVVVTAESCFERLLREGWLHDPVSSADDPEVVSPDFSWIISNYTDTRGIKAETGRKIACFRFTFELIPMTSIPGEAGFENEP